MPDFKGYPPLELGFVLFDWAERLETEALKVFGELAAAQAAPRIIECAARAKQILQWNGQTGAVIEVLVDDVGFASCRVVQTGHSIDDALYRSVTDGSLEHKSGRALDPGFKASRSNSQFVWFQGASAVEIGGMGAYGAIVNRSEATLKMIKNVATDELLTPARDWRQASELQAISRELQRRVHDSALKAELIARTEQLAADKQRRARLDDALRAELAEQDRLRASQAVIRQLGEAFGLAAAIAQVAVAIKRSGDRGFYEGLEGAKSVDDLKSMVDSRLTALEQQSARTNRELLRNAMAQNEMLLWLSEQARLQHAPAPALKQPRWAPDGQTLELPLH